MIRIKRYIIAEVLEIFLAVIIALILIMSSFQFAKLLSEAANGKIIGTAIFKLLGLQTVSLFVLLSPFAFFISVMLALSKLAGEHQLIALRSVGFSSWQLTKSILALSIPLAVFVLYLSLSVLPKALALSYDLMDKARKEVELSILNPGQFRSIGQNTVVYASKVDANKDFSNFFIWQRDNNGSQAITVAKNGVQIENNDERELELYNGARYSEDKSGVSSLKFKKMLVLLPEIKKTKPREKVRGLATKDLIASDDISAKIELQRRISSAISVVLLGLFAPLLITINPREAAYGRFVVAILLYAIYLNSQYIFEALMENNRIGLYPGIYFSHICMLAVLGFYALRGKGYG